MSGKYCQFCGKLLQTDGRELRHSKWKPSLSIWICDDCYQQKPRCRICNLPITTASPLNICPTCLKYERICRACGKPIEKDFIEIEGLGLYCKTCYREREVCDICNAPLTDEQWKLSDGRITCAHCHFTAIYSPEEASALYDEMQAAVLQILGIKLNIPTGLALVDRNQLVKIIRDQVQEGTNLLGSEKLDPTKTLGVYIRRGMRRGIYVQSGLPRTLLLQISAHEFAHAWQGENCPLLRNPLVHEGFAEWVAYRVLDRYGNNFQKEHMRKRTDIYGRGLNWALEIEEKDGPSGVINACKKMTQEFNQT